MEVRHQGPATRFANISVAECRKQLNLTGDLGQAFQRLGPQNGVASPMRITGSVGPIDFRVPPTNVPFGVLDCRQALLWIQLIPLLSRHEVVGIRVDNFYRDRSRIRGSKKSQHAYGLAADIVSFSFKDGRELNIDDDFMGRRGEPPCGPSANIHPYKGATEAQIEGAIRLRNLICELGRVGAFHHILTPNYNQAHESHLHVDLKRDNKWFSIN